MLCCEPSLAELGNLGTLGNLAALLVFVLENCKGREKCSSFSWTKMSQKLRSQHAPTLFWVVWGCFFCFFVLNISDADCLFEIHSVVGKECLFVRQVLAVVGKVKACVFSNLSHWLTLSLASD